MECIIKQSEYDGPKILLKALEAFEYSHFCKLDSRVIVEVGDKTVGDNATFKKWNILALLKFIKILFIS